MDISAWLNKKIDNSENLNAENIDLAKCNDPELTKTNTALSIIKHQKAHNAASKERNANKRKVSFLSEVRMNIHVFLF